MGLLMILPEAQGEIADGSFLRERERERAEAVLATPPKRRDPVAVGGCASSFQCDHHQ